MLFEVLFYFLKIGVFGFGGPMAVIATLQADLVERRGWISAEKFNQVFSLVKAMPGPVAFQMCVYLGGVRAGMVGRFLAAFGIVTPAFLLMVLFGYFSSVMGSHPWILNLLEGLQVGALTVMAWSLRAMAKPYLKSTYFWSLLLAAILASVNGEIAEPLLIVGTGAFVAVASQLRLKSLSKNFLWQILISVLFAIGAGALIVSAMGVGTWAFAKGAGATPVIEFSLLRLFSICFKAGAFVFGTGLAIVPLLERDFVTLTGWLSHADFMNALAFGQITPGPVVISATYIGFKLASWKGAFVATTGIFVPSFFHMSTWFPYFVERLSRLKWISAFLLGAMAAVVGSLAVSLVRLGNQLPHNYQNGILLVLGFALLLKTKLSPWMIIVVSGVLRIILEGIWPI